MLKRVLPTLCCLGFLVCSANAAEPVPPAFETKAVQAFMIEATTGTVLLAKNEDQSFSPASLAKIMTMDVVFDALQKNKITLDTQYPVTEHAWRTGGAPSRTSTMFAALKSNIRVEDLIRGAVIQSANDACIILAEGIDGTDTRFAERMTGRARDLGLRRSTFVNPTGLPDPGNKTTVRDMVQLAQHLQQTYPDLYKIYAEPDFIWNKISQKNRNPMLPLNIGVDGLATGFSEGEGFSIVTSAVKDGRRLYLALAGLPSDKERTEETRRVLEWGLNSFESRKLFALGEVIADASVYGGTSSTVGLVAKMPVDIYIPISNPDRVAARVVYQWPLSAPVAADQQAGALRISAGNRLLREVPLFTVTGVETGSLTSRAVDALLEVSETFFLSWIWDKLEPG